MGYTFPDSISILKESIESLEYPTYMNLTVGFDQNLPGVHIYKVGGSSSSVFAQDRFIVDVYAEGRDAAYDTSEAIRQHLQAGSHFSEAYGLVDSVDMESSPADMPYASETVTKFTATFRADTRAR